MGNYKLTNNTGNEVTLNGIKYQNDSIIFDNDNPCEYLNFHESIINDAKGQKIPFDDNANSQYERAQKECGLTQVAKVFETFNDPLISPSDNSMLDGTPEDSNNETPKDLGLEPLSRNLIMGQPDEKSNQDPNTPPPQAPPSGEAEKRSNDENQKKTDGGDPVNLFTGEFYLEKVDFELPSVGFPFVFIRTYKSGRTFFGPWGYNWDHNYNIYLRILNNGSIAINTGSLQEDIYSDSGDSILYNAPRGVFTKLERIQNSNFILTFKGGMKWYFVDSGFEKIPLIKIEDLNNNSQQLIYNNKNQLETVIDTAGRRINFIYGNCDLLEALEPDIFQDDEFEPKLTAGKKYSIQYLHANNIEQLSAVITFPTPDFPNGLITNYEYDEDQALPELRNNILRVIDAKGQTIVENFYGTDTTDDSFNRVVKQYFMGGEYLFKYTNIRYIPPFDEHINDAYLQTEFYEPERPLKVFTFNFRGNLLDERFRLCADGSYQVWAQTYRYNKNGQMTEFYYANGMVDVYEYYEHDENDPLSVIERDGNLLKVYKLNTNRANPRKISEFTYENNFQKIEFVEDEAGSKTKFEYDSHGNLIKIIYPDTTLIDGTVQNNCETNLKYDPLGQLVEELSPEGRKKTYEYFPNGNGASLVKKITAHDNVSPLTQAFEYDALGNIKRTIDGFGNDILFEHNLIGQLVKTELPSINSRRAVYKFEYNEDRKIAKEYLPKGSYSDTVLNDPFIINEYFYDVASWLVEVRKYSNTESQQVTKIQRDFFGNVTKLINPIGQEFRNKYDDRNLVLEESIFSNSEFPLKTKYDYDRLGNLKKIIHPDKNEEKFSYDSYARLITQTNHLGVVQEISYGSRDEVNQKIIKDSLNSILQMHKFSFDEKGRLKTSDVNGLATQLFYDKDNLTIKTINHQGSTTKLDYDGIGRTILVIDPLGNRQASFYDANGNVVSNDTQSLSDDGNFVSLKQQVAYDERNRPVKTIDALGNNISFIYDDRNLKTGVINALGQQVNMYYDINGQTIKTGLLRAGNEIIINQWNRDTIGRLNSYQDAENNFTNYFYDEKSNLVKTQYEDNSVITKEYDTLGFLIKETDCNGTVSNFTYNPLRQLTGLNFQVNGGTLPTPDIKYAYDSFGRQNAITRGIHTITKKFDNFNRLIEEKQGTETIKKIFDDVNNTIFLNFPDGRADKYKLDELGRIKEVVFEKKGTANCLTNDFSEGTVLSEYEFEGLFLKSKVYANSAITEYSYDIEGRLSGMNVKNTLGMSIDKEQYLFDGEKRKRIIIRDSLPNVNKLFNYDELSRLTESYTGLNTAIPNNLGDQQAIDDFLNRINTNAATYAESYSLSNNDKRTSWNINGVQYNTSYNNLLQLNSISGGANINYTYDKNGNRISDNQFHYFYDALDNLVKVVRKSDNVTILEHHYDGEGRIIERKENNSSNVFYYDGLRSIHESQQNGTVLQNTFGVGLDEYIVQSKGQSNYFHHQNSILSLNCITDKNSDAIQYFDFSSFGSPTLFDSNKNLIPSSNSLVSILFSGRPQVTSIDKYDFRKRIYDQEVGLFVQKDVYQNYDSPNTCIYCGHNPVDYIDPLGTKFTRNPILGINADDSENLKKLINNTSFEIWNAFSGGAPEAIYNQRNLGTTMGVFESTAIGINSFTNILTLGFQNSVRDAIGETQVQLMDMSFDKGYDPSDAVSAIWINVSSVPKGIVVGAFNNVSNWLPGNEIGVIADPNSSVADKWSAAFSGISKAANLFALGAGLRQNATSRYSIEVGTSRMPGSLDPRDYHSSVYFPKSKMLSERDGRGTVFTKELDRPKKWDEYEYFSWKKINLSKKEFNRAQEYARKSIREDWDKSTDLYTDNCSMHAHKLLREIGIKDILGISRYVPELLKTNVDNLNLLKGIKSYTLNSAIKQTEKKK